MKYLQKKKHEYSSFPALLLSIFFFAISHAYVAQTASSRIAELEKKLQSAGDGKTKIEILNSLGELYLRSEPAKARTYGLSALELSRKTNNAQGKKNSANTIGNSYYLEGDYNSSLSYYLVALKVVEEINDKKGIANGLLGISNIYSAQGNNKIALEYLFKSLKIMEDLKDKEGISGCYNNIGVIYMDLRDYDKALEYQLRSLKLKEEVGDKKGMSSNLGNIGAIYFQLGNDTLAMQYQQKAFAIRKQLNNKKGIAMSYIDIGNILEKQGKYEEALQSQMEAVKTAKEVGYKVALKGAYLGLSSVYEKMDKSKESLENFKLYTAIKDSIFNKENSARLIEMQTKFSTERKEKEITLLTKQREIQKLLARQQQMELQEQRLEAAQREKEMMLKENELQGEKMKNESKNKEIRMKETEIKFKETEIANQRMWRNSVTVGLILVCLVAILLFISIRQKMRANKNLAQKNSEIAEAYKIIENSRNQIAEKNKSITDSINYASTIQQAILPSAEEMGKTLNEYFVFYRPKDIVSGDFYFYAERNEKTIIAVADCTGHGVPGAFMSMIGNDLLNNIIIENGITRPAEILNQLNKGVKKALRQKSLNSEINDGMDIAICSINSVSRKIEYAGAMRPLYYTSGELKEIAGDKVSIGGRTQEDFVFRHHELTLNEGDCIYMLTDGYVDQFGGAKGKKFMAKNLRKLLAEIHVKKMSEQKGILDQTFINWTQDKVQVDDILVMGVRV